MRFFRSFFGSGKPMTQPDESDRNTESVSRDLTPEKIDRIMAAADYGDTRDQVRLSQEILEKNVDILQAVATRHNAVLGLPWRIHAPVPAAKRAAELLETELRECGGDGDDDNVDTFEDMLEDMLGALLPGFAVSEILWLPGGHVRGFRHIDQRHFTFAAGPRPLLITDDRPEGVELDRRRILYHKRRIHGGDPVRGGLIRPLAWLHCFKHVGEKDLLGFIERHGMPFVAAKVDQASFDREKNLVKRLIRNFGSSGGGVFTRNVELQLLEVRNTGEAYFRLLDYLDAAVQKVVLGQTASSGAASGWSKGDAQSAVRQDIMEADCRKLQRLVNSQLVRPWMRYNFGPDAPLPEFRIDAAPPEDKEKIAQVVKTLHDAGYDTDAEEVGRLVGLKLARPEPAVRAMGAEARTASGGSLLTAAMEAWLGPVADECAALSDAALSDAEFGRRLAALAAGKVRGDSAAMETAMALDMVRQRREGARDGDHD